MATKERKKDRMHLRNTSELCFLCKYVRDKVNEIEKMHEKNLDQGQEYYRIAMEMKNAGNMEEYKRNVDLFKEVHKKYSGTWFTNTVNYKGQIDLSGDYKKIKAEHFRMFLGEAEEIWARENKEKVLGLKMLVSDLKRCGVITTPNAQTHRPVDSYGKRTTEGNVKQVMEFCISQINFFADSSEG